MYTCILLCQTHEVRKRNSWVAHACLLMHLDTAWEDEISGPYMNYGPLSPQRLDRPYPLAIDLCLMGFALVPKTTFQFHAPPWPQIVLGQVQSYINNKKTSWASYWQVNLNSFFKRFYISYILIFFTTYFLWIKNYSCMYSTNIKQKKIITNPII